MTNTSTLAVQHTSLQFSDDRRQQNHDCRTLFEKGGRYPIKTGTESGPETFLQDYLRQYAHEFNHEIVFSRGVWVAVDKKIIKPRTMRKGEVFVVSNDQLVGRQHDRTIAWMSFQHVDERIGKVAQAATHYSTKGRTPGDPNYDTNKMIAEALDVWFKKNAKGRGIAFANGDFNMLDTVDKQDWAFGGPWTSMADELDNHQDTGHGPIDGMCSYNRDGRVKAKRFEVLRDNKLHMHTDHYVCRGAWSIKHL